MHAAYEYVRKLKYMQFRVKKLFKFRRWDTEGLYGNQTNSDIKKKTRHCIQGRLFVFSNSGIAKHLMSIMFCLLFPIRHRHT